MNQNLTKDTYLVVLISEWRQEMRDLGLASNTIKAYTSDLKMLQMFFPADCKLKDITLRGLHRFLENKTVTNNNSYSEKSISRKVVSIKAFFRWTSESGIWIEDPSAGLLSKSATSPLPDVLTPIELKSIKSVINRYRNKKGDARPFMVIGLYLETGIKKSELLALKREHIDIESDAPHIFIRYKNPKYRFKERKVPISDEISTAYTEYVNQYEIKTIVFPWTMRRIDYVVEDIGKEAGLSERLSPEKCRWTCAFLGWNTGVEPEKIRQKLGLSEIQWREKKSKLEQLSDEVAKDKSFNYSLW